MSSFLVSVPGPAGAEAAARPFEAGLAAVRRGEPPVAETTVRNGWSMGAAFSRENGSGAPLVTRSDGSWLIAAGTWFHEAGRSSGDESWLLERLLEVGAERLAAELEGFFVLVAGDARERRTVVVTDLVGSCHAFRRTVDGTTVIGGSSLLLAALGDAKLDPIGCQEFLQTGVIYENRTLFADVEKLEPSSVYRFDARGGVTHERYWRIEDLATESLRGDEAVRRLAGKLTTAAHRVGDAFARPVCDLTGGYDSRAIFAAFDRAGVDVVTTVSGPADSKDVLISTALARMTGVRHLHQSASGAQDLPTLEQAVPLTDGEYDMLDYSRVLRIHRGLSREFDVSVNGSFGEVARGYWWELLFPRAGARAKLDSTRVARARYAALPADGSIFRAEQRLDLVPHFAAIIDRTNAGLEQLPNTLQMDHAYLRMRMQRWQGRIASSTDRIWPCLSPFMFRSVLETMLQTSSGLRRRNLLARRLIGELSPRLADYPLEKGHPAAPVRPGNLHRFAPLAGHYVRRALSKVGRRIGIAGRRSRPDAAEPPRIVLWRDETVRERLRPADMRLAGLADPQALERFVRGSREPGFVYDGQWFRLLTLESALAGLERGAAPRGAAG